MPIKSKLKALVVKDWYLVMKLMTIFVYNLDLETIINPAYITKHNYNILTYVNIKTY